MPKKRTNDDTLGLRGLSPYSDFIAAMEEKHHIPPQELGRGLFAAAHAFWKEHGFFSFPVRIEPEEFQRHYIEEVAERQQAPYRDAKGGAPPGKGHDKSRRRRGAGPADSFSKSA